MNQKKQKGPTLNDVAYLADTSVATASYVLNGAKGKRYITEELRERVLEAARELHYSKSLVASGLKGKSRKILTLLIPHISNIFFARIVLAIEQLVFDRGYIVHICNTFEDPDREKSIIEQAISQRVDGIFIAGTPKAGESINAIKAYDIPFLAVERPIEGIDGYNFVGSNNFQSGMLAGEYLVENGHRNICYIEWMRDIENMTSRREGFEKALVRQGNSGGNYIVESSAELDPEAGYRITEKILKASGLPTAFLFGHHKLAEGGVACLRNKGYQIPREVSVMIIGAAEWVELNSPRFTYIRQPADLIGSKAVDMMLGLIEKTEPRGTPSKVIYDCDLVVGETVRNLNGDWARRE